EIRAKADETGASTPWPRFNELTGGLTPGSITNVIGYQGSGKSSWAGQLGAHHADQPNWRTIYYLGEMPAPILVARITGQRTGRAWQDVLKGKISDEEMRRLLEPMRLKILSRSPNPLAAVQAAVLQVRDSSPRASIMLVVDYVQLLAPAAARDPRMA